MLRQIECWVQSGPVTKNRVFPVATLICSLEEPLLKSWFDVSTTWMSIFVLFVSTGVIYDGTFSLWVSLMKFQVS